MKSYIIIFLACIFLIPISCKKYEEGPLISFRSPISRVLGQWHVKSYLVNEVENIQNYIDSCGCIYTFSSTKELSSNIEYVLDIHKCNMKFYSITEFYLSNNDEILTITKAKNYSIISDSIGYDSPIIPMSNSIKWKILLLKNKELKIETNYKNNNYVVTLYKN